MAVYGRLLFPFMVALLAAALTACNASSPTAAPGAGALPDLQPGADWTWAEAPGWSDQAGFSLMLPPGWTFTELQGVDSYVGEVSGDGIKLMFDYGWHSWPLNPDDEPDHEYTVHYEQVGGLEAKMLLPVGALPGNGPAYEAATGIYFADLGDGYALNLIGRGLTAEQQREAVAIFRGIRPLK